MTTIKVPAGYTITEIDLDIYLQLCPASLSIRSGKSDYEAVVIASGPYRGKILSRYILGILDDPTKKADHIDRNTFNNTRSNLRIVDDSLSMRNRGTWGASKYKGVHKAGRSWASCIMIRGVKIFLGTFPTEELAAKARKEAELKYWSETE